MRKNNLFVIALLGYSVIALCGCAKREIKNIDSKGKNIICFGDSVTFGYGVDLSEAYPSILAEMVMLPVINKGIDADTSTEALKRVETDVLDREPFLVIVEFGGNDFLRKVPKDVTVKNIREIIRKIQAKGAIVAVADISSGMFLAGYRSALNKIARQEGAIFIPSLLDGIITNPSMKSDFLHPNAQGYKIITQRIYRAILPYIEQKNTPKN